MLNSAVCTHDQLDSPGFREWATRMRQGFRIHRKLWEFCYIAQALHERGKLQPGMRGLGFAVGTEPLPALFASMGCTVVATDLDPNTEVNGVASAADWASTNQHATSVNVLNADGICPAAEFAQRVSFRYADMNHVPAEFTGFDFVWSSCAIEHVGSLDLSKRAVREMMKCLKPGGVAVHTTEFNVMSNEDTFTDGPAVIWRKRDLEVIERELRREGHKVEPFMLTSGEHDADKHVDQPPYKQDVHLKLQLGPHVATSVGIIIEAEGIEPTWWTRLVRRRRGSRRLAKV